MFNSKTRRVWAQLFASGMLFSLLFVSAEANNNKQESHKNRVLSYQHRIDRVLKIKEIRHLDDADWAHNLEIEFENVSGKPIYFYWLFLKSPDWKAPDGKEINFDLTYGKMEFFNLDRDPDADDIPIKAGETFVLTMPKFQADDLKALSEDTLRDTNRMILQFYEVYFGDRTGYLNGQPAGLGKRPTPRS